VVFLLAAAVIPANKPAPEPNAELDTGRAGLAPAADGPRGGPVAPSLRQVLIATVSTAERRAFTAAVALGGIAMSTVLVYQVPSMTAAGLPLGTAATVAGIRGFAQTGGRIPLNPMVNRLGSRGTLILSFVAMTVGGVLLAFSGTIVVALCFAIIMGFGIGAFSPLQGMTAEELFERETLGATMGSYSTVLMVAGASGPAMAGIMADATGDRRIASVVIVVAAGGALASAVRLWSHRSAAT